MQHELVHRDAPVPVERLQAGGPPLSQLRQKRLALDVVLGGLVQMKNTLW